MEQNVSDEREARAARNESLFRVVNERLVAMNEALATMTETFVIACECADTTCVEMLDIRPDDYLSVRADSRWFIVLPGHVVADVERVIREVDGYVIVEKFGLAGEVAEAADSTDDEPGGS